jgi:nitric oxide reductase activation protein
VVRDFAWMLCASTDQERHSMAVWAQTLVVDTFAPFFAQPSTLPSVYTTISLLQQMYQKLYTLMGNNPYPLLFAGSVVMGVDTSAWSIEAIEEERQAKQQSKREQISLYRSLQEQRTKQEKQAELLLEKTAIDIHNAGPVQTKESSNAKYKPWKASDISVLSSAHFQYPEWDCHVGNYRNNWTTVREFIVQAGVGKGITDMGATFATETAQQYAVEISILQRRFQAIQAQRFQRVVGAYDGDDIDLSKWMEFYVQKKSGLALDSNLYTQHKKMHRDIAVGLLMDLSSSTNEITEKSKRIVDIEKEAIFVLAEAVQSVGDKFAVYAWSGYSRHNVEFYVAKELQEPWNQESQSRLGQLYWNAENRDGAAIRHCVQKMRSWSAQKKILFVVSDGRPSDGGCPDYHDVYAQEDTKQALIEAKKQGIHSFCVTVDPYGQEYLESMFGVGNFIVIEDIASLPEKIGRLYYSLSVGR